MLRIIGTICSGDPDASVSYTVGAGSMRVASSCAKYCMTTLWPCDALARVGRLLARQHPHQRRLADAVRADERDAIAALDVQVEIVEDDEVAVGLARVLQLEHHAAALARTAGKSKWIFLRSGGTSIGTTFSSILIRLCTCDAFVAW